MVLLELRDATKEDLEAIRSLVAEVVGEYGFPPEPEGADADLYEDVDLYFGDGGMLRVLEERDCLVGVVGVVPYGAGTWELRKIYLKGKQRGSGQGRRLLEEALAFARSCGAARLVLQSSTRLTEALRLYERAGFARVDEAARGTCDVFMELGL